MGLQDLKPVFLLGCSGAQIVSKTKDQLLGKADDVMAFQIPLTVGQHACLGELTCSQILKAISVVSFSLPQ